jgi:prohibitin 1
LLPDADAIISVEGGHRAIIFDRLRGVMPDTIGEGTHFRVPWLQKVVDFDVRTRPRNISTTTGSKDMQMVSLTLRVLHRPEYENLQTIYQTLGLDYDDRVLPSIGNEVLKAIVAQFDAGELITQRELVCIDWVCMIQRRIMYIYLVGHYSLVFLIVIGFPQDS